MFIILILRKPVKLNLIARYSFQVKLHLVLSIFNCILLCMIDVNIKKGIFVCDNCVFTKIK